ncbi:MFS transporter [Salsipaludibacter albus]|uniref:MFS transporter n=1 Tax=Salsipaludibacter albus TaxID=2849650 RepID=UPI001EE48D69|nr:MFS transporter [Salsipaludibacter albus]
MTGYVALLRRDGAGIPWGAAILSRVVLGMSVVSVILLVRRSGYGYGTAGLAAAVSSFGTAAATPVWGRLIDRRGPARLLWWLGVGYLVGMVNLAVVVTVGAPIGLVLVSAAVAGMLFPPVSAVARVGWRRLYGIELRDRAFSLDGVTTELGFVTGPIMAAALVDLVAPWVAVVVAGLAMATSTVLFTRTDLVRGIAGTVATIRGGAVRVPAVRVLMLVFGLVGVGFGSLDVLAPAVAEANGRPALAGVLLAAFALGSAIGGLVYGSRSWPGTRHRRLHVLTTAMVGSLLAVTFVLDDLLWFGLVALVAGLVIAPSVVIIFALADDLAPSSVVTEALSWLNTAVTAGAATGAAVAGQFVEHVGIAQAVYAGAAVMAIASLVVARSRTTLDAEPVRA